MRITSARRCTVICFTILTCYSQPAAPARRRRVLALGDTSTRTYQHAAISHAMATIERLGRESGLYDTWIRTDPQLITKKRAQGYDGKLVNIRNLDDFDAIFFFSIGELAISADQKADLLRLRRLLRKAELKKDSFSSRRCTSQQGFL